MTESLFQFRDPVGRPLRYLRIVRQFDLLARERRVCRGCGRMRLTTLVEFSDQTRGKLCNECLSTWNKRTAPEGAAPTATGGESLSGFPRRRDPGLGVAMRFKRPFRLESEFLERGDAHPARKCLAFDCEQECCAGLSFALGMNLDAAGDVMLHLEPPTRGTLT